MTMAVNIEPSTPQSMSAVSWGAIIAGSVAAAAFALMLTVLGTGIGLASISPWGDGAKLATVGALAIAWSLSVQLFAFGLGGYIAGRLRVRWADAQADEVYFRDTAHGLLVWSVGTIASACIAFSLLSGAGSAVGNAAGAATGSAASATAGVPTDASAYYSDLLFRSENPANANTEASKTEVGRIFARAVAGSEMTSTDRSYAAQVIARQTGINPADAERRLTQTVDQAKTTARQAADTARKAALYASLWALVALLLGAFSACYMATVGAGDRDEP